MTLDEWPVTHLQQISEKQSIMAISTSSLLAKLYRKEFYRLPE
jgi:hypothetical protein